MSEIAIKIEHVSKEYRLGAIGGGTLRGDLQSWWARVRGKEDPNLRLDQASGHKGDRFLALNDVSMEIKKGEAVGIIGHNGAGKSTLLKLLCRVTAPTKGTISYNGRIASMLEVGTGFHPELTGRENVYMNGAILGMSKAEIDKKFDEIVAFAEMERFIDTPVKRYSSGMYVKLAFSVAAHLDSEIMIMDEVLAVGDMAFQKECLDKMRDAAKKDGRTVLYVSHNMNTIRQLCDRCVVMDHGTVAFAGEIDNAIEIYMGQCLTSEPVIDLCNMKRTNRTTGDIRLVKIEVADRDFWRTNVGEKLRYNVTVKANKDVNNVYYRNRLFSADGTSVTVLLASSPITCRAGEEVRFSLEADVSQLVPGRYCLTPSLYSANEYGGWHFHDHIDRAVVFEVETVLGFNNNMTWDPYWWGHVKLPELLLLPGEE